VGGGVVGGGRWGVGGGVRVVGWWVVGWGGGWWGGGWSGGWKKEDAFLLRENTYTRDQKGNTTRGTIHTRRPTVAMSDAGGTVSPRKRHDVGARRAD
jgi:hypothetical protein